METSILEGAKHSGQKYLGEKGLLALIAFLSAFIPLSTDLYLPALPHMADNFQVSAGMINLTLTLFFIFYAAATLFWGPLSDKYGRKPILITGLIFYITASVLCALSTNVYQLIGFRVLQAVASGTATSVGSAVVKDVYEGRKREAALALVFSMMMIAPIIAPVIGAFVLGITSWRGIFWTLSGAGILAFSGAIAMEETVKQRSTGNILQSLSRLGVVLKNPGFTSLLVTFALRSIPLMAFISSSSYIYIDQFGLSAKVYSCFFAGNAVFMVLGPIVYMRISRRIKGNTIISLCYLVLSLSGLLICFLGNLSPWWLAVSLLPSTLAGSVISPPSANLMLEQQKEDTGSASALMNSSITVTGSIGMILISFNWANRIWILGVLNLFFGLLSLFLWLLVSKGPHIVQLKHDKATI
ncbi:Drug resistance transporter, Bcr/CflA subfamily [Candidatus Desulfosporosinus infrequens]|uniref:Bcr/CflA family efflux transporter n=1 Tax=Candidatus Desulfosporosinus infrequens TaxID=2043169 RepID=A0A2U3KBM6_9FIRM|nr:Drug resistance transporter, Bcr/CflA subfamily [Candidatus Desulfosporosinus infrequens]